MAPRTPLTVAVLVLVCGLILGLAAAQEPTTPEKVSQTSGNLWIAPWVQIALVVIEGKEPSHLVEDVLWQGLTDRRASTP